MMSRMQTRRAEMLERLRPGTGPARLEMPKEWGERCRQAGQLGVGGGALIEREHPFRCRAVFGDLSALWGRAYRTGKRIGIGKDLAQGLLHQVGEQDMEEVPGPLNEHEPPAHGAD